MINPDPVLHARKAARRRLVRLQLLISQLPYCVLITSYVFSKARCVVRRTQIVLQEPSRVGDESEREPIDVLEVFEAS